MTIKGDLTTKDVIDRFKEMDDRYALLVKDIGYALGKLEETRVELQRARVLHEKGLIGALINAVNKNPRFSLCGLFIIVVVGLFLFKDKDWSYKDKEREVKTQSYKNNNLTK